MSRQAKTLADRQAKPLTRLVFGVVTWVVVIIFFIIGRPSWSDLQPGRAVVSAMPNITTNLRCSIPVSSCLFRC